MIVIGYDRRTFILVVDIRLEIVRRDGRDHAIEAIGQKKENDGFVSFVDV